MTISFGHNLMFCHQYPTRIISPWDNVSSSLKDGNLFVRNGCDCQHQSGRGLGLSGMVNTREVPINVVTRDKRKMLLRLDQNGKWSGLDAPNSPSADVAPPAERHDLTHPGTHTERGKPVVLPQEVLSSRESRPQGEPMGLRVWEDGLSECRSVIDLIGVALLVFKRRPSNITPRSLRAHFHPVFHHKIV